MKHLLFFYGFLLVSIVIALSFLVFKVEHFSLNIPSTQNFAVRNENKASFDSNFPLETLKTNKETFTLPLNTTTISSSISSNSITVAHTELEKPVKIEIEGNKTIKVYEVNVNLSNAFIARGYPINNVQFVLSSNTNVLTLPINAPKIDPPHLHKVNVSSTNETVKPLVLSPITINSSVLPILSINASPTLQIPAFSTSISTSVSTTTTSTTTPPENSQGNITIIEITLDCNNSLTIKYVKEYFPVYDPLTRTWSMGSKTNIIEIKRGSADPKDYNYYIEEGDVHFWSVLHIVK
jgi:hypothetical protein